MKNRTNKTYLLALCAGVLLLSACTENDIAGLPIYSDTQIIAQAQLPSLGIEQEPSFKSHATQAQSQTRAVADPSQQMTFNFVRSDETGYNTNSFGAYSTTPLTATRIAGTGAQKLTFNTKQYYITNKARSRFTGWWPAATSFSGGVVKWTIDGSQDIMTAAKQDGSVSTPMPDMAFEHRLTQLRFHPYAENEGTIDAWGNITNIEVLNHKNIVSYNLSSDVSGTVTFTGDATLPAYVDATGVPLGLASTADEVANVKQVGNTMMIAPQSSSPSSPLKLRITTKNQVREVTLTQELKAGTPYRLNMCFKELDIIIEANVVQWDNFSTDDNLGHLRVGDYYYTNGTTSPELVSENGKTANGVVYYVNPDDQRRFKVMALDQAPEMLYLAKSNAFISTLSQTDSKENAAAIKAYFDANTPTVGSDFKTAFPAAEYCYNYKGKGHTDVPGTWYVPAKNDLQYLWCAYNGATSEPWDSGTCSEAPVNAGAQKTWDGLLTVADGTKIAHDLIWSSTENSDKSGNACRVDFNNGSTAYAEKNSVKKVRCVRDINLKIR